MNNRRPKSLLNHLLFLGFILSPHLFYAQTAIDTVKIDVETVETVAGEPAVFIGETIELSVGLSPGNYSYQWLKDDIDIIGANSATYTIYNVTWDDALARYTCRITDAGNSDQIPTYEAPIEPYQRDASGGIYSARQFMAKKGNVSQAEWDKLKADLNVTVVDECLCELELWEISGSCQFDHDNEIFNLISMEQTVGHAKSRIEGADFLYTLNAESYHPEEIRAYAGQARQLADERLENAPTVRVAVVDGGVDNHHEALSAYQWNNSNELPNDKIDNDNNCLIDDIEGYDFVNNTGQNISDPIGHGTHVAGIIASLVPQNAPLELIDVKIFDDSGYGNAFDAICGLYYSVLSNADIINVSWGYTGEPISLMDRVIRRAKNMGILVVASAGNEGHDVDQFPHYPSGFLYPNVVSVTAIDNCDRLRGNYSSAGKAVDIAAYGYDIYSTLPLNHYGRASGTSMAAPAVTGFLVSTLFEHQFFSYESLKSYVANKIITLPHLNGKVAAKGKLDFSQGQYIDLDLSVKLGGALSPGDPNVMLTELFDQQLIYGLFSGPTFEGFMQPYFDPPWDYNGSEGEWTYLKHDGECSDELIVPPNPIPLPLPNPSLPEVPITGQTLDPSFPELPIPPISDPVILDPEPQVVDWVLVSFREDFTAATEFRKVAAQLLSDGSLHFLEPRVFTPQFPQSCYIVIEHRNHLPIMSPQLVSVQNGQLSYDFSTQNSYISTGSGQNEHAPGNFSMIPGDANGDTDVNGADYDVLMDHFGLLGEYQFSDLNLDGNVDFADEVLHKMNDGQYSSVPK